MCLCLKYTHIEYWSFVFCLLPLIPTNFRFVVKRVIGLYNPASPSTSYRAPSPTRFWVSPSRWMSRFRFLNHRNQCDQMLEKSSPNFSKSCSKFCALQLWCFQNILASYQLNGWLWKEICRQSFSQIAQSGRTNLLQHQVGAQPTQLVSYNALAHTEKTQLLCITR